MSLAKEKKKLLAKLSADATALNTEMTADEAKRTAENREKFAKLIADGKAMRAEIDELEDLDALNSYTSDPANGDGSNASGQKSGRGDNLPAPERKSALSIGEQVVASQNFKNLPGNAAELPRVDVKGMFGRAVKSVNSGAGSAGTLVRADRETDIIDIARQQPLTILDLIATGETGSNAVEYMRMVSRTNNAAVVPEWDATQAADPFGNKFGLKPQGDLQFDLQTAPVKTVAEWIAVSRQILSDAANLRSTIDDELLYQLKMALQTQIIAGDGTGNNFTGIRNASGIQTRVHQTSGRNFAATDTVSDTLRKSITDIELSFYEADGVLLHPQVSEKLELEKGSDGHYTMVYDPVQQRIWRVAVVRSPALAVGEAFTGAFKIAAKLWNREQGQVYVGTINDYFVRNALVLLAELRAAFAVVRPAAIEKSTGF